jgi:hypothetical protein
LFEAVLGVRSDEMRQPGDHQFAELRFSLGYSILLKNGKHWTGERKRRTLATE